MVLLMSSRTLMVLMSLMPSRTLMLLQLLPLLQLFLSRMGTDPTTCVMIDDGLNTENYRKIPTKSRFLLLNV